MKVRCSECMKQNGKICSVKKIGVALNKSRICKDYVFDETKVREKHIIPSEMRSDWYWRKDELKRLIKLEKEQEAKNVASVVYNFTGAGDPKHPLTGDLSRFVSTGVTEETGEEKGE